MSRLFLENGDSDCPVTVINAGPCYVTQIKTIDKEGYNAVQISYRDEKEQSHQTRWLVILRTLALRLKVC